MDSLSVVTLFDLNVDPPEPTPSNPPNSQDLFADVEDGEIVDAVSCICRFPRSRPEGLLRSSAQDTGLTQSTIAEASSTSDDPTKTGRARKVCYNTATTVTSSLYSPQLTRRTRPLDGVSSNDKFG